MDFWGGRDSRARVFKETKVDALFLGLDAPADDVVVLDVDPSQDVGLEVPLVGNSPGKTGARTRA